MLCPSYLSRHFGLGGNFKWGIAEYSTNKPKATSPAVELYSWPNNANNFLLLIPKIRHPIHPTAAGKIGEVLQAAAPRYALLR